MNIPKIEGLTEHQVVTLSRARKLKQYEQMRAAYVSGACLFCDPLGPKNIVLHQADGWRIWENPFPEPNTSLHLVMASVRHISTEETPTVEDYTARGKLFVWACERYGSRLRGGGDFMRFGDPLLNAGTILHLHSHIMVPDLKGEVRLPLAKEPVREAHGFRRLAVFEKLLGGASAADMTDEERALLEG